MRLFLLLIVTFFCLTGCSNNSTSNYFSEKVIYDTNTTNEKISNITNSVEEELFLYKTKIYTKTEARQNNVQLACNQLNNTIVSPGNTFSFCDTLGPAKPENGYQKADTFESDGDIIQEYGGGKCQVSSTLYNAVKDLPGIEIVERHEHSNDVPYVSQGLDAAVSYGSVDFKFKNNNQYSIKIVAEATSDEVIVKIIRLS